MVAWLCLSLYSPFSIYFYGSTTTQTVRTEDVVQLEECLPSMHEAQGLIPSTTLNRAW